jgi:murein DD-endopeptidase MepM/ murein hydrolase activator NlpD
MTASSATESGHPLENAGESRHFSLSGGFAAHGRALSDARIALLVLLASTLLIVSCATVLDRNAASSIAAVEPAPPREIPQAAPVEPPPPPVREPDPLAERRIIIPVRGVEGAKLQDNFDSRRGRRMHNALDIMAPRGTPVVAVDDGRIVRAYYHALGGLCLYQVDPDSKFAYYYAHLDAFAKDTREGRIVKKGDVLGYVGTTGNATPTAPHLHFAIHRLASHAKWWRGTPINPYPYLVTPGTDHFLHKNEAPGESAP